MDSKTTKRLGSAWVKRSLLRAAFCAAVLVGVGGCSGYQTKPELPKTKYIPRPADANLPAYMRGTVRDLAIVGNTGNFPVTNWGLVVGLRNTGDSTCPTLVHDWMVKEMHVHRFGSAIAGYASVSPEEMLNDSHVAIVGVVANIPPGARKGDYIDATVQVMPGNNTSSLANGMLYRSELKINGITDPVGAVNFFAKAQGDLFVNPFYAANSAKGSDGAKAGAAISLRTAVIPHGAMVTTDRPIHIMLRNPSWATSRAIEARINQRFVHEESLPDNIFAMAQDEGYLHLMLPHRFRGNWQHFVGIVTHLYMNGDSAFTSVKAKELAQEAVKPNANLMDISYGFEALGESSIPFITPLLSNPNQDVQFAAARAAAFLGDSYGMDRLVQIAGTPGHAFQINAVQTLGELPGGGMIDARLAALMDSDQTLVRIAAYNVLCDHGSAHIFSKVIHSKLNPENEFVLDMVNSSGPPLIYCTRIGRPRVAIFGRRVSMQTPVVFSAFDSRLTIANLPDQPRTLHMFYRDEQKRNPIQGDSSPDVAELVARLGGASEDGFHFGYGDVVAILQSMAAQKTVAASFVLQQLPDVAKQVQEAPSLEDSRPQADAMPIPTNSQIGASLPDLRPAPATQPGVPVSGRPQ